MRILVVGAGAIGGYFGGRLLEKGEDVTFLVREKRKQQLEKYGLLAESVHGDMTFPEPKTIQAGEKADAFDVILLSTKAYHLEGAIEDIRPFTGDSTLILPLLNGIAHMDQLTAAFGAANVLGGLCFIETTLGENGKVIQTSPVHDFVFGERSGEKTERILKLQEAFSGTKANFRLSENIEQEMWHKYLFISTLSGVTSLFRSPIGPIRDQAFGLNTVKIVLKEASAIMRGLDAPLADGIEDAQVQKINEMGYEMKSSLQRDMEKQQAIEADHFFGYLLKKAELLDLDAPVIGAIYANLKVYEKNSL
ncbi:ketopantoate reductase family protein [Cytobacillus firmus]|jgi:2-dehydropantoate 2-reductase|uniref:2-dehydropantoate 2-reductase n=2 Tax=Cytobacillus TaxID=2675230 RepID=A0ABX3CSA5_9BACI|nr:MULTISPECIES: ketopantoate reductase family protein [Cytobacillus]EFV75414.1 2-dehydropantoate 2-reductase [Bacillus sp. 2_A_57_CT2]MBG9542815.1 2-dehydropantoate 2-reductase [Cytobacillus firmus]MBG9548888.1 2-dehydropantoate 2-reductase [Cytobacillus firmus]MBG9554302.1 2-dehydropantoate 2-reductase [Cytobacillus firmus]MBG9557031.1 2-dehydropantoate 2-reductase [Cytobacillus firmus]